MSISTPIALVTGGSKGIGAAIAKSLALDGFDIWLNYNSSEESAKAVQQDILSFGRACTIFKFDVRNAGEVTAALEDALKDEPPFALINNAGFARDGIFGLMPVEDWKDVLDVHLNGFFNVTRLALPYMQRKRQGRIINIVSVSGLMGTPGQVNYSAAKSGLIGATKALAREVAKRNILVNAVAPGMIATEMTEGLNMAEYLNAIPLGRIGEAEEVADCVSFLCSKRASYITGQVIGINGGLYT